MTQDARCQYVCSHRSFFPAAIVATLSLALPLHAQVGVVPGNGHSLQLELARPSLDKPGLVPGLSSAWTADVTLAVSPSERVAAFGRIGFGRASIEGQPSSATFSNPRLGVVVRAVPWVDVEVHADPPLMQEIGDADYATTVARVADYEHLERFWPDAWSLGGSIVPWRELSGGLVVGASIGGTVINSTVGLDRETILTYAGFMRFPVAATEWSARLSGIALISEEGLGFAARTIHFGYLSISAAEVPGRPGLFIRAPVDTNLDHVINWAVGVRAHLGW